MGDLHTGLGYLCCCCARTADHPADGARFRTSSKADPRERAIDEMFMAREYRQDAAGRFVRQQPAPAGGMLPYTLRAPAGAVKEHVNLEVPQRLALVNSASTGGTAGSKAKEQEQGDAIALAAMPPLP